MSAPSVKGLNCPNCGGPVSIRAGGHSLNVVCVQCLSILDARDPSLRVLQTFQARERYRPLIPLGTRGKLRGELFEVIGFQVRQIVVEGEAYHWSEYLLFNPFKGFRYLTEYEGHWNYVSPLRNLPEPTRVGSKQGMKLLGESYALFQTASASTIYVMGEFPWQVRVGETVAVADYIHPPRMLSSETTGGEVTWSLGEYVGGDEIWKAFQLQGAAPAAKGVYANQPSPHAGKSGRIWRLCLLLLVALFAMMLGFSIFMRNEDVFRGRYTFRPGAGEPSFITPPFELKGRTSNVELTINTDLENDWAYFSFALINEKTGDALDFGREVSYYHGRDSDGNWSEGGKRDRAIIPSVAPGRYYLRIEPETSSTLPSLARPAVNYEIILRRDVPYNAFFWVAGLLLLIPPVFAFFRSRAFEGRRWQESSLDAGSSPASGSDSDSSEED